MSVQTPHIPSSVPSADAPTADIACIAYFTLLSTLASLIQQVHLVAFYRDVTFTQFEQKSANPDSPDHNISNGSVGMDLVLYYIREFFFSILWQE